MAGTCAVAVAGAAVIGPPIRPMAWCASLVVGAGIAGVGLTWVATMAMSCPNQVVQSPLVRRPSRGSRKRCRWPRELGPGRQLAGPLGSESSHGGLQLVAMGG